MFYAWILANGLKPLLLKTGDLSASTLPRLENSCVVSSLVA